MKDTESYLFQRSTRSFPFPGLNGTRTGSGKALLLALLFAVAIFPAGTALAANSSTTFSTSGTNLALGSNYSPAINPVLASGTDVVFSGSYASTTLNISGTSLSFGSLNDEDTTQNLVILNNGATGKTITLNGGDSVSGNTADLLYVEAGGNLTIQNGTGTLTLDLQTGNIDNAGSLTLASTIAITTGSTVTFTGTGTTIVSSAASATTGAVVVNDSGGSVTFSGANANTGGFQLASGSLIATTSAAALGNGTLTLGGGVLDLQNASGTALSFNRNTTVTGNTQITSDVTSLGSGNTYTFGTLSIGGQTLAIAGGPNVNGGTAGVTFGVVTLTGTSTFNINNPAGGGVTLLTVGALGNGGFNLTLTGAGNFAQSGAMSGAGGLILGSGATLFSGTATLNQANTFGGGLDIKGGTVIAGISNSGVTNGAAGPSADAITLGDSAGASASLLANAFTVSNNINLGTGAVGTLTIGNNGGSTAATFGGAIAMDGDNLTISSFGTGSTTVSGGVSGTGSIIISNGSTTATTLVQTNPVNNIGSVTNSGGGNGATTISGGIGSNVTAINQNSSTSALILSGIDTNYDGTTNLNAGILKLSSTTALGGNGSATGTGGALNIAAGTTLDTGVATTISTTNAINVNGSFTYGSSFALNLGSGTITLNAANATITNAGASTLTVGGLVTGTGNLTVDDNAAGGITLNGTLNTSGTFTNNGTGAGTTKISNVIGSNVQSVVESSSTSGLSLTGTNNSTFGGSLVVQSGLVTLIAAAANLDLTGTGIIILGSTNSTASATILNQGNGSTTAIANSQISLAAGDTGILALAASYTGASDPLIINSPIALNGDNLLFLGGNGAFTVNGAITGTGNVTYATFKGVNSISEAGYVNNLGTITTAGPVTFSGTIAAVGNSNLNIDPTDGIATVNNPLQGSAGGLIVASAAYLASSSGQSYGSSNGTLVLGGIGATFSGQTQILSGNVQLNGAATTVLDTYLGQGSAPVLLGNTSGVLQAALILNSGTLNRAINIQAGNAGNTILGGGGSSTYGGSISLNKSVYFNDSANTINVNGAISRSASAPGAVSVVKSSSGGTVDLNNPNSYDGGTVMAGGVLVVSASGVLGSGNAVVEAGVLRLSSTNATPGSIYVGPLGMLSSSVITGSANGSLASFGSASVLDKNSSGAVGIAATYSTAINLASLGDGTMFLAADNNNQTYSATSLGANTDGNYRLGWNSLNSGNTVLTVSNGVLIDGTNGGNTHAELIVGGVEGKTDPLIAAGDNFTTEGSVLLSGSNNYSGGTVVNSFSTLSGLAQTTAGASPFGSSSGSMTLHNSTLQLNNNGTSVTTTTLGALSFDGNAGITVNGGASGSDTLALGSITRNHNGTLTIAANGATAILTATSSLATTTVATGASTTASMVAPYFFTAAGSYLTYGVGGTGFVPITSSYTTITAGSTNQYVQTSGAAQTISASGTIAALSMSGATAKLTNSSTAPVTLGISGGALNTGGATAIATIGSSGSGTGINLDFSGYAGDAVINTGAQNLVIVNLVNAPNGLTKAGTGTLNLQAFNTSGTSVVGTNTIGGTVTVNGGWLSVNGTTSGVYSGTEVGSNATTYATNPAVDSLNTYSDSGLGTANLVLNGGGITTGDVADANNGDGTFVLSAGRSILIGPNGGSFSAFAPNANQNANYAGNVVVNSAISGTGAYVDFGANAANADGSTDLGLMVLTNTGNNFLAPINVYGKTDLVIGDSRELGNSANLLTLDGGNASLQYGVATTGTWVVVPAASGTIANAIEFMNMGGGVDVVQGGTPVTLTLSGQIGGDGSFFKNGLGTLVLTATGNTFEGSVIVNSGILVIDDPTQLGNTTAVVSGSNLGAGGVSGNAAYVEPGAELDVKGNIAVGGTGGKTLYVSGTGAGNGGAIVNLSGSNSDAGQVVLQANTTIAVDAGSQLKFSGAVSDGTNGIGSLGYAITETGSGTLLLTGSNTYTGATNINSGTLAIGNVSTGSAAQSLGENTSANAVTLGVAGTSSGTLLYVGTTGTLGKNITALGNGNDTIQSAGSGLLTLSGTLTKNGTTLTLNGGSNGITVSGHIVGSLPGSDLVVTGGTTTLTNSNTYVGATIVNSGGVLNAAATGALGSTSTITVNTGGTLLAAGGNTVANNSRFNQSATVTGNGGTIGVSGGSTSVAETLGALTLTANSAIDFGSGTRTGATANALTFASLALGGNTLNVFDWNGDNTAYINGATTDSGGNNDELLLTAQSGFTVGALINQINFYSGATTGSGFIGNGEEINFGGGGYEIVPVPEPATVFAGLLLIGLLCAGERRRLASLYRRIAKKSA